MTQRSIPDWPKPEILEEPTPRVSRRAWGKIPYQERFRRQRRDLLAAAGKLASADGIRRTTIEAVTSEAGVAKRVFYEHFADKEACFVELYRRLSADIIANGVQAAQASVELQPEDAISATIVGLRPSRVVDRGLLAALFTEAGGRSPLARVLADHHALTADLLVALAARLGSPLPEATLRLAATLLVQGVSHLGSQFRRRPDISKEVSTVCCLALGLPTKALSSR